MTTRIFVAGATGYTGREVVRAAAARGAEVIAHVRPDSPGLARWRARFEGMGARVDTTAWDDDAMAQTLTRLAPTHVFALLGTTRARGRRRGAGGGSVPDTYEAVDYGLTAILLRAARVAASKGTPPRFVYLSAIGARLDSGNEYVRVRGRLEHEIAASGLPYLIVRPAIISGGDRGERRRLERAAAVAANVATTLLGVLGARRMRARYRTRTGAELAEAMVRLALDPRTPNMVAEGDALD